MLTERGWVLLDFEGEPARPLPERRRKRPPLRDVAGMLRSFSYAKWSATKTGELDQWERETRAAFLGAYEQASRSLYPDFADVRGLLELAELEKALYELRYETKNRPRWAHIPAQGLRTLLGRG
jgi:predicted trehalose synthase